MLFRSEKEGSILTGFEAEIREIVGSELEKHQVAVHTGVTIDSLAGENGAVQFAQLSHPKVSFPVDLVVVSTGIAAKTRLAQTAGVRTGNTGAIAVDWKMQTNVQNIFAAGDCVEVKNLVSGSRITFRWLPRQINREESPVKISAAVRRDSRALWAHPCLRYSGLKLREPA